MLSVLSALAFSWLGEMAVSILHQYPFIAITVVFFHDSPRRLTEVKAIVTQKKKKNVWLSLHTMACNVAAPSTQSEFVNYDRVSFETSGVIVAWQASRRFPRKCGPLCRFLISKV